MRKRELLTAIGSTVTLGLAGCAEGIEQGIEEADAKIAETTVGSETYFFEADRGDEIRVTVETEGEAGELVINDRETEQTVARESFTNNGELSVTVDNSGNYLVAVAVGTVATARVAIYIE